MHTQAMSVVIRSNVPPSPWSPAGWSAISAFPGVTQLERRTPLLDPGDWMLVSGRSDTRPGVKVREDSEEYAVTVTLAKVSIQSMDIVLGRSVAMIDTTLCDESHAAFRLLRLIRFPRVIRARAAEATFAGGTLTLWIPYADSH